MSSTPPPLPSPSPGNVKPQHSIPYASQIESSVDARTTSIRQAASASWVAPVIATLLNLLTISVQKGSTQTALAIGIVNLVLVLVGFVAGIVALNGMKKVGRRGVLVPAIIGLVINGLLLSGGVIAVILLPRMRAAAMARTIASKRVPYPFSRAAEQLQSEAIRNYPGWRGQGRIGPEGAQSVVAVASIYPDSALGAKINEELLFPVKTFIVTVDTSKSKTGISITGSSMVLHFKDGSTGQAFSNTDVLARVKSDRSTWEHLPSGCSADAGAEAWSASVFVFTTDDVDPQNVDYITIGTGADMITMNGTYLTWENKSGASKQQSLNDAARRGVGVK